MARTRPSSPLLIAACISLATLSLSACEQAPPTPSQAGEAKQAEPAQVEQVETKRAAEPPAQPSPEPVEPALPDPPPSEAGPPAGTPAPAKPTPGPVTLSFAAAKIMPAGKPELAVTLGPKGEIGLGGTPDAMTISADGKVTSAEGKLVAEVEDGGVLTLGGRKTGIVLTTTGLQLSAPNGLEVTMVFHPETGEVVMNPPAGPGMKMVSEGCNAPVTKSCALVLSLYLLAADSKK